MPTMEIISKSVGLTKQTDLKTTSPQRPSPQREMTLIEMLASEQVDSDHGIGRAIGNGKLHMPSPSSSSMYSDDNDAEVKSAFRNHLLSRQHGRNESLHVNWTVQDIIRMAHEITNGTIAPVHLSLLGYWIRESHEHYEMAKTHIRELSLDQGYNVKRIKNEYLRNLLIDIKEIRPKEARGNLIVLPPAMREERERALQKPDYTSPVSSPTRDYPPNTPDRPQPLSVKSRHSEKSIVTPTAAPAHRTVSLPVVKTTFRDPISSPRSTLLLEDTTPHPLLFPPNRLSTQPSTFADPDDVFGIVSEADIAPNRISAVTDDHCSQWINASSRASSEYATSLRSVSLGESASNIMIRSGYASVNSHEDSEDVFDSLATTLASFPIPYMQNPVGALPMLVSRATLSEESAAPVGALVESCRSTSGSRDTIREILEKTRARGEMLPVLEWKSMSAFERSWREIKEELLVAIYGRQDTWLSSADVAYVDCIEKEFRARPEHWVLECFRAEAEVF